MKYLIEPKGFGARNECPYLECTSYCWNCPTVCICFGGEPDVKVMPG